MELNTVQQPLSDNSDDEELPDIFTNDVEKSDQKYEAMPGDIVWAEFRKLYWPALIRTVFKKNKKVSVWYLDSPRKCFKVPFRKIKSFSDANISRLIRQEVENSPVKAMHEKVLLNAITYIRRKTEGHKDDPAAYFDLTEPYLTFRDPKFSSQNDENITNAIEPMKTNDYDVSEEESIVSSDDEESELSKKISRFVDIEETDDDKERTQAIVDCITTGCINKHLLKIKNKKTHSAYQELFEEAMKTDRKKLLNITACEIVKNLQKLKEISIYLLNFYEKVVEGGKCEMIDYVTSVWLPEAINKADEMIREGKLNLNEFSSGTRRKLFPSDKLEIEEMPDYISLNQKDKCNKLPSKKAAKKCQQTKKVKGNKRISKSLSRSSPRNLRNRK